MGCTEPPRPIVVNGQTYRLVDIGEQWECTYCAFYDDNGGDCNEPTVDDNGEPVTHCLDADRNPNHYPVWIER